MKRIPRGRFLGRLFGCGLVLVALSFATVRLFEVLESAQQQARARETSSEKQSAEERAAEKQAEDPGKIAAELWIQDPQGSPVAFWGSLVALAEDPRTPPQTQKRAQQQLRAHSRARIHELILRAMVDVDGSERELREERELYTRKRKEILRDISELKLRYPLAEGPRDPNTSPEDMQQLAAYALSYKRDRMILDGGLARLSEVLEADTQRITMEQNVFRSHACQLQKFLDAPGYLPVAPPKTWDPTLLPPRLRRHLPVTFESVNLRLGDLLEHLSQLSGMPVELATDVAQMKELHITLRITDQDASLAANWTARLADLDIAERDDGLVLIAPDPKKAHPVANPSRDRPAIPNDTPGDF